jgi:hypothetical protein
MTEGEIIWFVQGLPGAVVVTADEAGGAPRAAWGDSFFFYDPGGHPDNRRLPFATIVSQDYDGFDTSSNLNRPGIFRLNVAVGRQRFEDLLGYLPAEHASRSADIDFTVLDRLLPHPAYGPQAWVSILCPGERTDEQARRLLEQAHRDAAERVRRRP